MAPRNEKAVEEVSRSIENFTIDFHKSLARETEGNFVLSALSVHTALSMAAYGAEGSTGQAMRKTLHLPEDDSLGHQGFQSFIDSLEVYANRHSKLNTPTSLTVGFNASGAVI